MVCSDSKQNKSYLYIIYICIDRYCCVLVPDSANSLVDDGENSIMVSILHLLFVGNRLSFSQSFT